MKPGWKIHQKSQLIFLSSVSCSVSLFLPHMATSQGPESLSPTGGISPSMGILMSKQQSQLLTEALGGVGASGVFTVI